MALTTGCIAPVYTWDTHTSSAPRPASFDIGDLAREPVTTLGVVAPAALQGLCPAVSQALTRALADTSPPIRAASAIEALSTLNERGLASEYAKLLAEFGRSGILERERLGRIAGALGSRYVLLPGLGGFDDTVVDRFEITGFKLVRNRVVVLRLWLQLWDARSGRIAWESSGEVAAVSALLTVGRTIPLDGIAEKLWRSMLEDDLLADKR